MKNRPLANHAPTSHFESSKALDAKGTLAPVPIELWYRLPSPRGGRLFGLSRSTLTELALAGAIKSVLLRKPGAKRGIRLIHGPSLQQYLLGEMEAQMKTHSAQANSTTPTTDQPA